jgi:hypothetical protein
VADTTTWHPDPHTYAQDWYNDDYWTNGVPDENKIAIVDRLSVQAEAVCVKGLHVQGTGLVQLHGLVAEEVLVADQGYLASETSISISSDLTLTGGGVAVGTNIEVPTDATLRIDGPGDKNVNGGLHLSGTGVWSSDGRLWLSSPGLDIDGTLEIREDALLFHPSPLIVRETGRIIIAAGRQLTVDGPSLSHQGVIELGNGSALDLRDGEHVFLPKARLIGAGTVALGPGDCHKEGYNVGCQLSGPGPVTFEPDITFTIRPSEPTRAVAVFGPLKIDGCRIEWTGGTLYNDIDLGELTSLTISGDAPRELNGSLHLAGQGRIDCSAEIGMYDVGIQNGGSLVIASPATISGSSALTNSGRLEVGAPLQLNGINLINCGTINVGSDGRLTVSQTLLVTSWRSIQASWLVILCRWARKARTNSTAWPTWGAPKRGSSGPTANLYPELMVGKHLGSLKTTAPPSEPVALTRRRPPSASYGSNTSSGLPPCAGASAK